MTKYVRKPIVVEAHLWNGYDGIYEIIEEMVSPQPVDRQSNDELAIHTLQGTRVAHVGDYVCRGDEGQVFVMVPGEFKRLYVEVREYTDEEEEDDDEVRMD